MIEIEKEIKGSELPTKALNKISARQKSYLDEFRFYIMSDETIEAWYGGEYLATWNGITWLDATWIY